MDELEKFLAGGQAPAAKGVITDQLLDSLRKVESGKDRFAINKETKAMGPYQFLPETVQMLHKQGIEFNPFNEKEARGAAKTYLGQLLERNQGDLNKALAQYGGFVTKDPSAYVQKVTQGAAQPTAEPSGDPLEAFLSGKPVPKATPATPPAVPDTPAPAVAEQKEPSKMRGLVADILGKGLEMRQQLPGFMASTADVIAGAPSFIAGTVGYGAGRLFGLSPEEATAASQKVAAPLAEPVGKLTGTVQTEAYQKALPKQVMDYIGGHIEEGAKAIAQRFGVPEADVQNAINAAMIAAPGAVGKVKTEFGKAKAELMPTTAPTAQPKPGMVSAGAAAVPSEATIQQAMQVVSPELKKEIASIPVKKINIPTLQRHIEADTLPVPVRLTEGQATGDVVKLSHEQNRRGKDPVLAQRFNEQNGQLIENLEAFRERAAPDAPGSRTMDHSQALIDAYKELDNNLNANINQKYQALRDAAGGQFPVDAPKLLTNVETRLKKELLSNEAPAGQFKELQRLAEGNNMTFEDYLSLRRNLGDVARTATDGQTRRAASLMIEELEKLPLQKEAAALKPLADQARKAARDRFQMLEKDPAYRAAESGSVPADKFLETFVVKGHNKNVQEMINHLGADSVARQHMAAGTINFLRDRAGIIDGQGNFTQAGYNKALKFLDDSNKMPLIFDGETATGLKTLGNVARYTQAQPRGAFVNNSNTLVGALAEKASGAIGAGVEKGLNVAVPGLQLGTTVMEMRARRAAEAQTQKALKPGAGIKQD